MTMPQLKTTCRLLIAALSLTVGTGIASADTQKSEGSKGITLDDLGRGLKSAANSVEKEIPKIGPAIGNTFKKITGNSSEKKPAQDKK
jgi:hypothetical protein